MNGKNITTGTVHHMKANNLQACGTRAGQVAYLETTTEAITCGKCAKVAAPAAPVAAQPAKVSPVMVKTMKVLVGGEWTSWSVLPAGIATLAKMVAAGMIEANAEETAYRAL